MGQGRLELPRLTAPEFKSGLSTISITDPNFGEHPVIRTRTPFEETVLQTAAPMPYLPDAQDLAESLGIEPSRA